MGYWSLDLGGLRSYKPITIASLKGKAAKNPLLKGETLLHRQLKDSKKEKTMNEHRQIEDFKVFSNHGVAIFFDDGSHTYIDPEIIGCIINEIICFEELHEDLPFPEKD